MDTCGFILTSISFYIEEHLPPPWTDALRLLNWVVQFVQIRWVKSEPSGSLRVGNFDGYSKNIGSGSSALLCSATTFAVIATHSSQAPLASSTKLSSFSNAVSGNATAIDSDPTPQVPPNQVLPAIATEATAESTSVHADVSVSAKIANQNDAVVQFNITSVTLKIGSTTYTGSNGTGIFNQHSLVVVVHATVTSGSTSGMLILIGHASTSLTTNGSTTVTFSSPQSKLASSDFLSLKGTLTVS